MNEPKILITGCPKSATRYISFLLKRCGLDIGHEELGEDGVADWMLAPGAASKPFRGPQFEGFNIILHQTRHPLNMMSSMQKLSKQAALYMLNYLPNKGQGMSPVEISMAVYHTWSTLAEETASWTYRIESLYEVWDEFCDRINHQELKKEVDQINIVPKDINSAKPYMPITWDICMDANPELTEEVKRLAKRYGYEV